MLFERTIGDLGAGWIELQPDPEHHRADGMRDRSVDGRVPLVFGVAHQVAENWKVGEEVEREQDEEDEAEFGSALRGLGFRIHPEEVLRTWVEVQR